MQNQKLIYGKGFQSSDLLKAKQRLQISLTHPQNKSFLFTKIFPNLTIILKFYIIRTYRVVSLKMNFSKLSIEERKKKTLSNHARGKTELPFYSFYEKDIIKLVIQRHSQRL